MRLAAAYPVVLHGVAACVRAVQDRLGRRIALENPSSYLRFRFSTPTFLRRLGALRGPSRDAAVALARYERARARALRAQGAGASERARASVLRSAEGARLHEFALDVETDWRRFARGERILCLRRRRTLLALFRRAGAVASLRIPAREVALLRGTLLETAVASAHRSGLRPSWIRAALACWVGAGLLQVEPALEETR